MSFKNTGLMFALRVVKKGKLEFGGWPDDCPIWLQSVMDDLLSELDNSYFEIEQLLNAFIKTDNYLQLKELLQNSLWFVDSCGVINDQNGL